MAYKTLSLAYIFSLVAFLLVSGCTQTTVSSPTIKPKTEAGNIVFVRPRNSIVRQIQFIDRFDNTQLLEFGEEDTIKISTGEPINVVNPDGTDIRWFRFYPNDTVEVTKSSANSIPVYRSGNSTRDKELYYLSKNSYLFFSPQIKRVANPLKIINNQANQEAAMLQQNATLHKFSKSFIAEESENINFQRKAKLIAVLLEKQTPTPRDLMPFKDTFNSNRFTYLLSFKQMSDFYLVAIMLAFKNNIPKTFEWIANNMNGKAREILLFKLLKSTNLAKKPNLKTQLISQYLSVAADSLYKNYTLKNQELANLKLVGKYKNLITDNKNRTKTINTLVAGFKNKVILIVLWASWCIPCRAEMPFSKKLRHELNNEDIRFIYISLDRDKALWENAEKELNLNVAESYLFIDSFNADFLKNLQVKTIPRYLIIGKNGSISQSDAPGPRDPRLKDLLLNLVN